jgi:hypothetical protein
MRNTYQRDIADKPGSTSCRARIYFGVAHCNPVTNIVRATQQYHKETLEVDGSGTR